MSEGPLFEAAKKGNLEEVRSLLASDTKTDYERDIYYLKPLMIAALRGHTDVVIAFTNTGMHLDYRDENSQTALMMAAMGGHINVVIYLIKGGADVNVKNRYHQTPLMLAAMEGHTDLVIDLIRAGADINYRNEGYGTPLMAAAETGKTDVVIELVKAKADINAKNKWGDDAISYAKGRRHSKTVSVLEQARDDFEGFLKYHNMTKEEKNNTCRREYGRAFALASRVIKSSNPENIGMSDVQKSLPPGYRDLIQFFSRNPGLVKWTGTTLLLYFNAGSLDVLGSEDSNEDPDNPNHDDTLDRGQADKTKCCCTVM